ncbi:hypothetical protein L9F63_007419, partial [Diploptera punctata]
VIKQHTHAHITAFTATTRSPHITAVRLFNSKHARTKMLKQHTQAHILPLQ